MPLFATRFRDEENGEQVPRLVVVDANDAGHARRLTGLVHETFTRATRADIEEWDGLALRPFTGDDTATLLRLIRRRLLALGARRVKDAKTGRVVDGRPAALHHRHPVRLLNELAAKVESIDTDEQEEA